MSYQARQRRAGRKPPQEGPRETTRRVSKLRSMSRGYELDLAGAELARTRGAERAVACCGSRHATLHDQEPRPHELKARNLAWAETGGRASLAKSSATSAHCAERERSPWRTGFRSTSRHCDPPPRLSRSGASASRSDPRGVAGAWGTGPATAAAEWKLEFSHDPSAPGAEVRSQPKRSNLVGGSP